MSEAVFDQVRPQVSGIAYRLLGAEQAEALDMAVLLLLERP
ncbi:hypothetical protein [Actinocrispum sp. NPDC049592]